MRWKMIVREWLTFSKKESIAVLVLLLMLTGIVIAPIFITAKKKNKSVADDSWIEAIKELQQKSSLIKDSDQASPNYGYEYDGRSNFNAASNSLFIFDPNNTSFDDWKKLGLREKTILTIQNYLNKGGRFKRKEDLRRIYGLRQEEYERLEPYIKLPTDNLPDRKEAPAHGNTADYNKITKTTSDIIDINTADTAAFISLPGIGSKLAGRIVNFRDKLGGFYNVEQISETYGLPDSTYQKIKPRLKLDYHPVKRMNVNSASLEELQGHPYIRYNLAKAITAYRKEHGNFSDITELQKILIITDEVYKKISPYLTTDL